MSGLQPLTPITMTAPCWEPGTQYNYGDIVEYEGKSRSSPMILTLIALPRCQVQNNTAP
jgi:hypothetical protein